MAKAKTKTTKQASPQKVVPADVPVGDIDTSPADAVRHGRSDEVVAEYAERMRAGSEFPPLDVYRYRPEEGGSVCLLADGGYRLRALKECGKKKARCVVCDCPSREEAERRACEHASGANADHGQARSPDDKWAAVSSVIVRAEYAEAPDRKLAELCRVSHFLVRKVREKLTLSGVLSGKAAAGTHRYKDSDSAFSKRMKGGSAATPEGGGAFPEPSPQPAEPTPATTAEPAPDYDDGTTGDGGPVGANPDAWRDAVAADRLDIDAATARTLRLSGVKTLGQLHDKLVAGERIGMGVSDAAREAILDQLANIVPPEIDEAGDSPPEPDAMIGRATDQPEAPSATPAAVVDEKGRPVPDSLLPVFAGRKWFRQFSQWVATAVKDVEACHAEQPFGKAICLGPAKTDAANLSKGVAGAMPYVVCPSCDGEGVQGKTPCPTCSNKGDAAGRGWLSRMRYQQLTPELKRVCEGWGKPADAA